jgi:protein-S-isoprenylcysteine O-methyltransferase Ste14
MPRLVKADNGMNILGQGIWIILFTAPAVAAAVVAHRHVPDLVRIPLPTSILTPLAVALVPVGLAFWLTALVQLLIGFPQGKLVTSGAYGVCRNPIYSSFVFFVLPGLSLASGTWAYLVVAAVLCLGVRIFIRKEERDLLRVFGEEYRQYTVRVHRVIPFVKPARDDVAPAS